MRIHSHRVASLPNVAFLTPQNKVVLIVLNNAAKAKAFVVVNERKQSGYEIPAQSVITLVL